jgi:hypothetical protein
MSIAIGFVGLMAANGDATSIIFPPATRRWDLITAVPLLLWVIVFITTDNLADNPVISNDGDPLTWNLIADTTLGDVTYPRIISWWAHTDNTADDVVVTVSAGTNNIYMNGIIIDLFGTHKTDPVPAGNVYSGENVGASASAPFVLPFIYNVCLPLLFVVDANDTGTPVIDAANADTVLGSYGEAIPPPWYEFDPASYPPTDTNLTLACSGAGTNITYFGAVIVPDPYVDICWIAAS